MMFSIFRSHRNRFYWRNGKLHFVKHPQQQQAQRRLTRTEERQRYNHNIRQWFIFYGVFISIIIAVLVHRLYSRQKQLNQHS